MPHFLPYQGSKRRLAPVILAQVGGRRFRKLFEPFAGSGALTLAAAARGLAQGYVLADSLPPLSALWQAVLRDPDGVASGYAALWQANPEREHFLNVRADFNATGSPAALLYLLARCVKNAPRWNGLGHFNQSADHRRTGVQPGRMHSQLRAASQLLAGRCEVTCGDFEATLAAAGPDDLVYLDPPYQGTSTGRDLRYHAGLPRARLETALAALHARNIPVLLSYDGNQGTRSYGPPLDVKRLGLRHLPLPAGRSAQATLAGRAEFTVESLYVSETLAL